MSRIIALLLIWIAATACGSSNLPAGATCKINDDCAPGLSCSRLDMISNGMCTTIGKSCTTTCNGDNNCVPLGADFRCFTGCEGAKFCGKTASPM